MFTLANEAGNDEGDLEEAKAGKVLANCTPGRVILDTATDRVGQRTCNSRLSCINSPISKARKR